MREVAQRGSFTSAAAALGYTQSAVSRQVAALETAVGAKLFDRRRDGASLTPAGARLLPRAVRILDDLDAALRDVTGPGTSTGPVRLGAFAVAASGLVCSALAALAGDHPRLVVTLREATTPALVRALRAGTLDLAVVAQSPPYRPLDAESPPLDVTLLAERDLMLAVGPDHPLAGRRAVEVGELADEIWVASQGDGDDSLLGVWPGLPGRPVVRYVVRDWLAKLRLVAEGLAVTTVAAGLPASAVSDQIRFVGVRGEPRETRRLLLARLPGSPSAETASVAVALARAAATL